jgi:hypothetical protein
MFNKHRSPDRPACGTISLKVFPASIPLVFDLVEAGLALCMLSLCTLLPVPLLMTGRVYLRRSARAGARWVTAWTAVASASIAVEAVFWIRLVHLLGTSDPNLPEPSWHALDFSAGFLIVGAAMAYVLIGATRSVTGPRR